MSLLLERHERGHQEALQDMCDLCSSQVGKCEVRKEGFLSIIVTNGFHLYGLDR